MATQTGRVFPPRFWSSKKQRGGKTPKKKSSTNGVAAGGFAIGLGMKKSWQFLNMKFYILKVSDGRGVFWKKYMNWMRAKQFVFQVASYLRTLFFPGIYIYIYILSGEQGLFVMGLHHSTDESSSHLHLRTGVIQLPIFWGKFKQYKGMVKCE